MTVFVNHALADGLHIARFYENLDRELLNIVEQIKIQDKRSNQL